MVEPTIIPRAGHALSRRDIDPDALKVLYRLRDHGYAAYLVGGSVRDLLLGRRPKDFDIGTSAHPYEIKRLFRNCWIIGRRFRLAHVKFGTKTIEVATFRRQLTEAETAPPPTPESAPVPGDDGGRGAAPRRHGGRPGAHHHNTFGTAEEDAFRRDFTINALFYDIATFSIIDYVGGLKDLEARVVRCIGDPDVRFHEDPVRMLRAVVLAARLDLRIDPPIFDAIARNRSLLATAAPARLLEEYFKILRSGTAERTFLALRDAGLLKPVTPELHRPPAALWESLRALDAYRARFPSTPESLTSPLIIGTLLSPLGLLTRRLSEVRDREGETVPRPMLGILPIARRDAERLRLILSLQRRLLDLQAPARVQHGLVNRPIFGEALTWLEVHGGRPDAVQHWQSRLDAGAVAPPASEQVQRRGRRRRRRRRRPRGGLPRE